MKNLLSKDEVSGILSMNMYWEEVAEREDQSAAAPIFQSELHDLLMRIGAKRILLIVGQYAKRLKKEEK